MKLAESFNNQEKKSSPGNALRVLPEQYHSIYSLDLSNNLKMAVILNLAGLVITVIAFVLLRAYASLVRPGFSTPLLNGTITITLGTLVDIVWLIVLIMGMLILHELIHGFFFWLFTHSRPAFGLGLSYAYAAAPDWYIPLRLYWIVGLAPLVLIALGGMGVMGWGPAAWLVPAMIVVGFNSGGAVGDIWIVGRLLSGCSKDALVNDEGHRVTFFDLQV
jgi:hypothetical protein